MYYRSKGSGTSENADLIVDAINDPNTVQVTLFASEKIENNSNTPLLFALAQHSIPAIEESIYIVFDKNVSTAQRCPRYIEVKRILDASEKSNKVLFSNNRVPYTAALGPKEAVSTMLEQVVSEPFTTDSRPIFFSMLSNLTEIQMRETFGLGE